jgi:hypothetical protein
MMLWAKGVVLKGVLAPLAVVLLAGAFVGHEKASGTLKSGESFEREGFILPWQCLGGKDESEFKTLGYKRLFCYGRIRRSVSHVRVKDQVGLGPTAADEPGSKKPARSYGEPVRGLAVSLRLDPPRWQRSKIGEVTMEIALKNITAKKLLIYREWAESPAPEWVRITDSLGRSWRLFWTRKQTLVSPPSAEYFLELAPREEKVYRFALETASFLPPDGAFSGLKKDAGEPSKDERVGELPPDDYSLKYCFSAVMTVAGSRPPQANRFKVVAGKLGHDDFWTGQAMSQQVKIKVGPDRPSADLRSKEVF